MNQHHTGSCLCGAITFEIEGPFEQFFLCHCAHCRKDTGSAHASNLFSSTAKIVWTSGSDKVTAYSLPGTRHARSFCSTCGSAMPHVDQTFVVVPAGCLDTPVQLTPNAHIFVSSKAVWDQDLASLPTFDTFPQG